MSDVQKKKTIQIAIITSTLFLIAGGCAQAPEASLEPVEPKAVGRYQIVSEPSGLVLKIDTHDGETARLVNDPETGIYSWELVRG